LNPHTLHTEEKENSVLLAIEIDNLTVTYHYLINEKSVNVLKVEPTDKDVKLRARDWLEKTKNELN